MPFASLGLAPELVRAVADEGYIQPTPVQMQAIPFVLAGRDLRAGAQTGTGKTAAFVLPMLQRLHNSSPSIDHAGGARVAARPTGAPVRGPIRALVLVPTRELALQVEESVRVYGRHSPLRSVAIYGGVGFQPQVRALRAGPSIVVATPGRLLDHVEQRTIDLSRVEILVLDEADRMLDMGFIRDIRRVLALLPPRRQNLLFSATFPDEIQSLAASILQEPASVDVTPRVTAAELVDQQVIRVDRHRKRELLSHLVRSGRLTQALVFTRTKHGANRLAEQLVTDGIRAAAIHGNKSQGQRVRALADFKSGRVDLLVATDIAARGLDIEALPHVVNFELPMVATDYVHRIGRTGRAGVGGHAISLVCIDEGGLLRDIQELLRRTLPAEVVPGFEPDPSLRPEAIRLRSGDIGRAGRPGRVGPYPGQTRQGQTGPGRLRGGDRNGRGWGAGRPAATILGASHHGRPVQGAAPVASPSRSRGPNGHRGPVALPGERLSRGNGPTNGRSQSIRAQGGI